jgi:hypothetical protein
MHAAPAHDTNRSLQRNNDWAQELG